MAKLLKKSAEGAATGGAFAGGPGAVVGGAFGIVNSVAENRAQKNADKRSRDFQREQNDKQFDRQKYFDNLEKRWNSEQAQLSRMRDAGLNPNLVYGQLADSTVGTPTVPLGSSPNGVTRDFSADTSALQGAQVGIDSVLKAAQTDNLNQNTANQYQDTLGKDIENRYKENSVINSIFKQLAEIETLKSQARKNGAETESLDKMRDALYEKAISEINLSNQKTKESEQNVRESQQNVEKSKQDVKESQSRVDVNKQNISESKQRIEESKQNIEESKSRISLNDAVEQMRKIETKDLLLKYHLSNDQYQMINDFVHKHNLPAGSEKVIIQALENFAQSTGKTIPEVTGEIIESWLDGGNWLNYFVGSERNDIQREGNQMNFDAQEHRTEAIRQGYQNQTEDEIPQRNGKYNNPEFDRSYTPNQKEYIRESRIYYQYLNQDMRQEYEKQVSKNPKMLQIEKAQLTRKLYYQQYGTNKLPDNE